MKKRFVLVLTDGEIGALRAALVIRLDGRLRRDGLSSRPEEDRAIAKIDAARTISIDECDLDAFDRAAGQMLDSDDWEDYQRGRPRDGDPRRARKALDAARAITRTEKRR